MTNGLLGWGGLLWAFQYVSLLKNSVSVGISNMGSFYYRWWTALIKPRLLFSHSELVSWGLPFLQFNSTGTPMSLNVWDTLSSSSTRSISSGRSILARESVNWLRSANVLGHSQVTCTNTFSSPMVYIILLRRIWQNALVFYWLLSCLLTFNNCIYLDIYICLIRHIPSNI